MVSKNFLCSAQCLLLMSGTEMLSNCLQLLAPLPLEVLSLVGFALFGLGGAVLQVPTPGGTSNRGAAAPLIGRFKERGFPRGEGNRNPSPLGWRFAYFADRGKVGRPAGRTPQTTLR